MKFEVVTTYADRHWEQYAKRFVETFKQHWGDIKLTAFTDADLIMSSKWLNEFKIRHADKPTANFKLDAVRFSHKVAAIELAYIGMKSDALIWIDADCVTHDNVSEEWLESLLAGADFAYLDRGNRYPECGFMIFRNNLRTTQLVRRVVDLYAQDTLFKLSEWHDSFAIEHVRKDLAAWGVLKCVSLSGNARAGHPFVNGPLGAKLDHLKGKRKDLGRSRPQDLVVKRKEPYWNAA